MKKILLFIISCCVILSSFCLREVKAKGKIDYSNAKVYTFDDNGKLIESNKTIEFFLAMLEPQDVSTYAIPSPDYSSIRITDIKYTTVDRSSAHTLVENLVEAAGVLLWAKFQGSLINPITGYQLGKLFFNDLIDSATSSIAKAITSNITTKAYLTSYTYKSWSDYYDCYLVYFCCFEYSDSNRTQIKNVYHEQISSSNTKLGL